MNYWLMKSEPSVFSIDNLIRSPNKTTFWDGVRNYQVRNMIRDEMEKGDLAFFYHSNCKEPGIVGIIKIISKGYPDSSAFKSTHRYFDPKSNPNHPRWFGVDVKFVEKFSRIITLSELRSNAQLKDLLILRKGNRLSITPVSKKH